MKKPFIDEGNNIIYLMTSELDGNHFGMVATWIENASLRIDEVRFTFALSKFNSSTHAILKSKKFIIHTLPKHEFNLAFKFGAFHSADTDKFLDEDFFIHPSGIRVLKKASGYGLTDVVSELETEDRHILYCSMQSFEVLNEGECLKHRDFFEQLTIKQKEILSLKYKSDSERDTPSSSCL